MSVPREKTLVQLTFVAGLPSPNKKTKLGFTPDTLWREMFQLMLQPHVVSAKKLTGDERPVAEAIFLELRTLLLPYLDPSLAQACTVAKVKNLLTHANPPDGRKVVAFGKVKCKFKCKSDQEKKNCFKCASLAHGKRKPPLRYVLREGYEPFQLPADAVKKNLLGWFVTHMHPSLSSFVCVSSCADSTCSLPVHGLKDFIGFLRSQKEKLEVLASRREGEEEKEENIDSEEEESRNMHILKACFVMLLSFGAVLCASSGDTVRPTEEDLTSYCIVVFEKTMDDADLILQVFGSPSPSKMRQVAKTAIFQVTKRNLHNLELKSKLEASDSAMFKGVLNEFLQGTLASEQAASAGVQRRERTLAQHSKVLETLVQAEHYQTRLELEPLNRRNKELASILHSLESLQLQRNQDD